MRLYYKILTFLEDPETADNRYEAKRAGKIIQPDFFTRLIGQYSVNHLNIRVAEVPLQPKEEILHYL